MNYDQRTIYRGFSLKEELKKFLFEEGYVIEDCGAFAQNPEDDYVDFARSACEKIAQNPEEHKGIFLCGSGHGMDMVANKFSGLRAALCFNSDIAVQSREHENANVLVIPSDWMRLEDVKATVKAWLDTPFSGEGRHERRLEKMQDIEQKNFKV